MNCDVQLVPRGAPVVSMIGERHLCVRTVGRHYFFGSLTTCYEGECSAGNWYRTLTGFRSSYLGAITMFLGFYDLRMT